MAEKKRRGWFWSTLGAVLVAIGVISMPKPEPVPTPTPTPSATVAPEPTPEQPIPTAAPQTCADVTCQAGKECHLHDGKPVCVFIPMNPCGVELEPNTTVDVATSGYGQGVDASLYVNDNPKLGEYVHHKPNLRRFHLEGHPNRFQCEAYLIQTYGTGETCPVWQWRTAQHPEWQPCLQRDPYESGGMSCDHFGNTVVRDDPNTVPFEGEPAICQIQRDAEGNPMAGFFVIAHGDGEVRACLPGYTGCGRSTRVAH